MEASPTMYMNAIRNTDGMKTTMTIKRDIKNQRGKRHIVIGLKEEKVKGDMTPVEMGNHRIMRSD